MYRFNKAQERWWNKPLAIVGNRFLPAELAILEKEITEGEKGVWMNSRGIKSGVEDVIKLYHIDKYKLKTIRINLPDFVSKTLFGIYESTGLSKGCPDLIIWNEITKNIRFIEVKCPHWDKPSKEQDVFLQEIKKIGLPAVIVEWEFINA